MVPATMEYVMTIVKKLTKALPSNTKIKIVKGKYTTVSIQDTNSVHLYTVAAEHASLYTSKKIIHLPIANVDNIVDKVNSVLSSEWYYLKAREDAVNM